jgi:hypothetical protein
MTIHIPEGLRTLIVDEAEQHEESLSEFSRKVFERYFKVLEDANPAPREVRKR